MSETQFKFRTDDEAPLYLDGDGQGNGQGADAPQAAPAGPLYLDRASAPPPKRRGWLGLAIASVVVFVAAAALAAFVLGLPEGLVSGRSAPSQVERPAAAGPAEPLSPVDAEAAAVAQEAADAAGELPPPPPPPPAEPAPAAVARAPEPEPAAPPAEASAPKPKPKPPAKAKPQPSAPRLDLDALARSLDEER